VPRAEDFEWNRGTDRAALYGNIEEFLLPDYYRPREGPILTITVKNK
jgi:hypothetical protein